MLKMILLKNLVSAFKGYIYWHKLVKKYPLKNCAVILIPSPNKEYSFYAIKYLNKMLISNHYDKALILSNGKNIEQLVKKFNCKKDIIKIISINKKKVNSLLDFYNANMFDNRFIVASLEEPEGRNMLNYLNVSDIEKKDLFMLAVYNITSDLELGVE